MMITVAKSAFLLNSKAICMVVITVLTMLTFSALLVSCKPVDRNPIPPSIDRKVSFIQLIANPAAYDSKVVEVHGCFHYSWEDCALYMSRDDAKYYNTRNAIWLSGLGDANNVELASSDSKRPEDYHYFEGKMVALLGVFKYQPHGSGHLNMFSGDFVSVQSIIELTPKN
jgi:hypothetical protein